MKKKYAWITWERQPRNYAMANLIGAKYYEFNYKKPKFQRYLLCIKNTIEVFKGDYDVIFVQNPSIVLCFFSIFLKRIYKKKLVIDAHNAGVYPAEGRYRLLQSLNKYILRHADITIVTNQHLLDSISKWGIKGIVITDPLPDYAESFFDTQVVPKKVMVICSWAEDEPIDIYLDTAKKMTSYDFYFTGNNKKYEFKTSIPKNVKLMGFVDESEYLNCLFSSSVILDLTTRDDCLVCGAYESISAEKPVVLTDNSTNRTVFQDAADYSELSVSELIATIYRAESIKTTDIHDFKVAYVEKNKLQRENLIQNLHAADN